MGTMLPSESIVFWRAMFIGDIRRPGINRAMDNGRGILNPFVFYLGSAFVIAVGKSRINLLAAGV